MPGMRDQFAHFYMPDDDAIATAMKTGLVVPDTNVLLSLYRFQSEAREQLFGALEKVSDRLWTPYQVGLEFHRNRLGVIAEQEAYFKKVVEEFDATADALRGKAKAFGNRIALDKLRVEEIERLVGALQVRFFDEVEKAEKANEVRLTDRDSDGVLSRVETLFENRVGEPMEPKVLEEAKKEARRRADAGIPPGYKDKTKPDPTGDYLVWRQLLDEAKTRSLPVAFITDDRKEDWYRREHGLTLGARYELREEMFREAGVPLLMVTTETFLRHAEKYLQAEVSEETFAQATELPDLWIEVEVPPAKPVYAGVEGLRKGLEVAYAGLAAQPPVTNIGVAAQVLLAAFLVAEGLLDKNKGTEAGVRDTAIDAILRSPEDAPVIPSSEERQESDHEPPESDDDPPTDGQ